MGGGERSTNDEDLTQMIKRTGCSFSPRGHWRKWELNLILWVLMFINWCLRLMWPSNYALLWKGLLWKFSLKIEIRGWGRLSRNYEIKRFESFQQGICLMIKLRANSEARLRCHVPATLLLPPSVVELMSRHGALLPASACWRVLFRLSDIYTLVKT